MKWAAFSPAKWRAGLSASLERFPLAILCGIIGAGCAIVGTHHPEDSALAGQCERLAMTMVLGLPLFFSLRMTRERAGRWSRWPLELVGLVVLAAWFYTHSPRPEDEPAIVFVRWGFVLAALHFLAAISPYIFHPAKSGFWQFNRRLFLRFALTTLYSGVLTIGLELALLSADKLFDLKLVRAYGDLFFLMVGCFHPIFFLAGVPRDFAELGTDTDYPRGLKAFTQFALAPLVLVYGCILYAYAIKIIALRSWPHGWVALPVLILSCVGIFASLLLHPLQRQPNERWAIWFGRIFPPALGPLALLLLLSIRVRISDYGVTEQRYIGIVAGAWIVVWALVFTIRRNAGIRWIPASLALIAMAVAFGPWSAGAVSKRSQLARLVRILQAHGLMSGSEATPAPDTLTLSNEEGTNLRSGIQYLVQMHGGATLQPLFARLLPHENWVKLQGWDASAALLNTLKIVVKNQVSWIAHTRSANLPIDIAGFRSLWSFQTYEYATGESRKYGDLRVRLEGGNLKFAIGDTEIPESLPLDALLSKLPIAGGRDLSDDLMRMDFEHDGRSFRIIFRSLQIGPIGKNSGITGAEFFLMEK